MLKYALDNQGGFTVGDTVTGFTAYAYPTSTHATQAKRRAESVAREMIASATEAHEYYGLSRPEHDARLWEKLDAIFEGPGIADRCKLFGYADSLAAA